MRSAAFAIVLTACASTVASSPAPSTATTPATIYTASDLQTMYTDATVATTATLKAPQATTWNAVKRVYADLEVPIAYENPTTREVGNKDFYKSRQFAGKPMADLINCGSGLTGQNATNWRIYMSLVTSVSSTANGGSVIRTVFTSAGRDMAGMSSDKIVCGSTGRLEKLLNDRVKIAVGG